MIGWRGGVDSSLPPSGGDAGCAGASGFTPGWCTGGRPSIGVKLGQFSGYYGQVIGDEHYLYYTDQVGNRLTRIPK